MNWIVPKQGGEDRLVIAFTCRSIPKEDVYLYVEHYGESEYAVERGEDYVFHFEGELINFNSLEEGSIAETIHLDDVAYIKNIKIVASGDRDALIKSARKENIGGSGVDIEKAFNTVGHGDLLYRCIAFTLPDGRYDITAFANDPSGGSDRHLVYWHPILGRVEVQEPLTDTTHNTGISIGTNMPGGTYRISADNNVNIYAIGAKQTEAGEETPVDVECIISEVPGIDDLLVTGNNPGMNVDTPLYAGDTAITAHGTSGKGYKFNNTNAVFENYATLPTRLHFVNSFNGDAPSVKVNLQQKAKLIIFARSINEGADEYNDVRLSVYSSLGKLDSSPIGHRVGNIAMFDMDITEPEECTIYGTSDIYAIYVLYSNQTN